MLVYILVQFLAFLIIGVLLEWASLRLKPRQTILLLTVINLVPIFLAIFLGVNIVYVTIAYVMNIFAMGVSNYLKIPLAKKPSFNRGGKKINSILDTFVGLLLFTFYFPYFIFVFGIVLIAPIIEEFNVPGALIAGIFFLMLLENVFVFVVMLLRNKDALNVTKKAQSLSFVPRFAEMLLIPLIPIVLVGDTDNIALVVTAIAYGLVIERLVVDILIYSYRYTEFHEVAENLKTRLVSLLKKYGVIVDRR